MALRELKKQQTRDAIIETVREITQTTSWEQVTTRQIAATAGVSYQTLYNYFPSKNSLMQAVLMASYVGPENFFQTIVKAYRGDLLDSIAQLNQARIDFLADKDTGWWLTLKEYFLRPNGDPKELKGAIELIDRTGDNFYFEVLSTAQGVGDLDSAVDIQLMAHTLWCIANSAAERYLLIDGTNQAPLDILHEQTAQLVRPYLR